MSKIESQKAIVNKAQQEVFNYLTDFRNFGNLMPTQVENFTGTEDTCSFTIKGMATLGMRIVDRQPNSLIRMQGEGKIPFNFDLVVHLHDLGNGTTEGQLVFESDMNPFMKIMVEKPLENFFNLLMQKLQQLKDTDSI